MPEICRFFGIIIQMYYGDHEPPHFHVRYGDQKARFAIQELGLMDGHVSPRVRGMVTEWASQHQSELLRDWELAKSRKPLAKINPLE
jgi:hypothetical protein